MKKTALFILSSLVIVSSYSMRLDPSDSIGNKLFDSVIIIKNNIDSLVEVEESIISEVNETKNQNGTWFMYGFLALGAVLVILKFKNRV